MFAYITLFMNEHFKVISYGRLYIEVLVISTKLRLPIILVFYQGGCTIMLWSISVVNVEYSPF